MSDEVKRDWTTRVDEEKRRADYYQALALDMARLLRVHLEDDSNEYVVVGTPDKPCTLLYDRLGKALQNKSVLPGTQEVVTQLEEIAKRVHAEEQRDNYYGSGKSTAHRLNAVLDRKRDSLARAFQDVRAFQEDVMTFLRAFVLLLETVASAATHGEKAARLRGLMELVESAAGKVRKVQFHEQDGWGGGMREDVFRCDYPVRHWMERCRDAEARAEAAEKELEKMRKPTSGDPVPARDVAGEVPF